jgi:hypothetical protein
MATKKDTLLPAKKRKVPEKAEKHPETVKSSVPGRKSTFTQAIADAICARLSQGEPLESICRDEDMPTSRTVSNWKAADEAFASDIAHAREAGFDRIAADCLDIADETGKDTLYGENGERANTEWISRSKLRIETRLKLLAKWDPKRYGEKMDVNHGGQGGDNPINMSWQIEFVKSGDES